MTEPLWLPSLSHFLNGNGWSGSEGLMRFELTPPVEGCVTAILWQNPFTRAYAKELSRSAFEISEEGLAALSAWLSEQAREINAHPPQTSAELSAWHDKAKREESLNQN